MMGMSTRICLAARAPVEANSIRFHRRALRGSRRAAPTTMLALKTHLFAFNLRDAARQMRLPIIIACENRKYECKRNGKNYMVEGEGIVG